MPSNSYLSRIRQEQIILKYYKKNTGKIRKVRNKKILTKKYKK